MTVTVQQLADIYFEYFKTEVRDDYREYVLYKDLENRKALNLVKNVVAGSCHNQTSLVMIRTALCEISECSDLENVEIDPIPTRMDLLNWLSDDYNRIEAINEFVDSMEDEQKKQDFDLFDIMETLYIRESYDVLYSVLAYLQTEVKNT